LEGEVRETSIAIVLLGAGGKGLEQRRTLEKELAAGGMIALIPEDDFPREIAPSLVEIAMLSEGDIELVFVNVESWGSATEFAQLYGNSTIAQKLRVLVDHSYHPLYGSSTGYLSDLYLTHTAVFGHVYAVDGEGTDPFPSSHELTVKLAERYRQWKAMKRLIR
jgi:hypothetical protein